MKNWPLIALTFMTIGFIFTAGLSYHLSGENNKKTEVIAQYQKHVCDHSSCCEKQIIDLLKPVNFSTLIVAPPLDCVHRPNDVWVPIQDPTTGLFNSIKNHLFYLSILTDG